MNHAAKMLHESYDRFNKAEQELYKEVDAGCLHTMKAYVQACKDLIMCNLHWRWARRYVKNVEIQ